MAFEVTLEASNTADFLLDITAVDADSGIAIDWTGVTSVSFTVKDDADNVVLNATLANGMITQPVGTTLEVLFPSLTMQPVAKGSYKVGCVYSLNGSVVQILTGSLNVYEGIATP